MDLKKWILFGITLVLISLAGNYYVFSSKKLPAPVFAKHYYELEASSNRMVDLHYFTNRYETNEVESITIPGTHLIFPVTDHDLEIEGSYKHKLITFELVEDMLEIIQESGSRLNQLQFHFSNGTDMLIDIGELKFFPYQESSLSGLSSTISSDNSSFQLFEANKDVEITGIHIPFKKQLQSGLWIGFSNDQEKLSEYTGEYDPDRLPKADDMHAGIFPMKKRKGELVSIQSRLSFPDNDKNRLHFYEIEAALLENKRGNDGIATTFFLSYHPSMNETTIKAIVRERE